MMKNSFRALAIVGVAALIPSLANAFTGNLVSCTAGGGDEVVVTLNPGFTCTDTKNAITVTVDAKHTNLITGCTANASAPWDSWVAGKVSSLKAADAATIADAAVSIKATAFGTCNFSGDPNSSKPYATGTVTFIESDGATKVKGGKATFFGRVAGDLNTQSAQTIGIITKGFGVGGTILTQVALDTSNLNGGNAGNGEILQCNIGTICPPDQFIGPKAKGNGKCTAAGMQGSKTAAACSGAGTGGFGCKGSGDPAACCTGPSTGSCLDPIADLYLTTGGTSKLSIDFTSDGDCTADGTPYYCCTGSGTGKCN